MNINATVLPTGPTGLPKGESLGTDTLVLGGEAFATHLHAAMGFHAEGGPKPVQKAAQTKAIDPGEKIDVATGAAALMVEAGLSPVTGAENRVSDDSLFADRQIGLAQSDRQVQPKMELVAGVERMAAGQDDSLSAGSVHAETDMAMPNRALVNPVSATTKSVVPEPDRPPPESELVEISKPDSPVLTETAAVSVLPTDVIGEVHPLAGSHQHQISAPQGQRQIAYAAVDRVVAGTGSGQTNLAPRDGSPEASPPPRPAATGMRPFWPGANFPTDAAAKPESAAPLAPNVVPTPSLTNPTSSQLSASTKQAEFKPALQSNGSPAGDQQGQIASADLTPLDTPKTMAKPKLTDAVSAPDSSSQTGTASFSPTLSVLPSPGPNKTTPDAAIPLATIAPLPRLESALDHDPTLTPNHRAAPHGETSFVAAFHLHAARKAPMAQSTADPDMARVALIPIVPATKAVDGMAPRVDPLTPANAERAFDAPPEAALAAGPESEILSQARSRVGANAPETSLAPILAAVKGVGQSHSQNAIQSGAPPVVEKGAQSAQVNDMPASLPPQDMRPDSARRVADVAPNSQPQTPGTEAATSANPRLTAEVFLPVPTLAGALDGERLVLPVEADGAFGATTGHMATTSMVSPYQAPHSPGGPQTLLAQVAQGLQAFVRQETVDQLNLTLSPEDLGRLRFEMTTTGDRLHITLFVERGDTMDLLRRNADQLLSDLRQSGFGQASLSFGNWSGRERPKGDHAPAYGSLDAVEGGSLNPVLPIRQNAADGRLDLRL